MSKYQVIKAKDVDKPKRKSPVTMILEDLPPGYLTVNDLAVRYDVHKETIRRLMRAEKDGVPLVNAPSEAVQQGGLVVYLFNEEDVAEMDKYMGTKGYAIRKNIK